MALHEVGHQFELEHPNDPDAPMTHIMWVPSNELEESEAKDIPLIFLPADIGRIRGGIPQEPALLWP